MSDSRPPVQHLPEPPLGRLNLLSHADGRTVAVFDPKTGSADARYELRDPDPRRDVRVRGRYAELRSGVLALYRDGAGRIVVQHGRRRAFAEAGTVRSIGPLLTLTVGGERLRMRDARGRPGARLARAIASGAAGEWV